MVQSTTVSASSQLKLAHFKKTDAWLPLGANTAKLLPLRGNSVYSFEVPVKAEEDTTLTLKLKTSKDKGHFTPDVEVFSEEFQLAKGIQNVRFTMPKALQEDSYSYICFMKNDNLSLQMSEEMYPGTATVFQKKNQAVSNNGSQLPPEGIGVDRFEFGPLNGPIKELPCKLTQLLTCLQ